MIWSAADRLMIYARADSKTLRRLPGLPLVVGVGSFAGWRRECQLRRKYPARCPIDPTDRVLVRALCGRSLRHAPVRFPTGQIARIIKRNQTGLEIRLEHRGV